MHLKYMFLGLPSWLQHVLQVQYVWSLNAPDDVAVLKQQPASTNKAHENERGSEPRTFQKG